jgi:uncharacterized membrane protein
LFIDMYIYIFGSGVSVRSCRVSVRSCGVDGFIMLVVLIVICIVYVVSSICGRMSR